jgi:hypothetical protein
VKSGVRPPNLVLRYSRLFKHYGVPLPLSSYRSTITVRSKIRGLIFDENRQRIGQRRTQPSTSALLTGTLTAPTRHGSAARLRSQALSRIRDFPHSDFGLTPFASPSSGITVAVGQPLLTAPRTDPYVRVYAYGSYQGCLAPESIGSGQSS